jgi:hypothetical protein
MGEASATSLKPIRSVLLRVSPMVAEVMDTGNAAFQVTITLQEIFHVGKGIVCRLTSRSLRSTPKSQNKGLTITEDEIRFSLGGCF